MDKKSNFFQQKKKQVDNGRGQIPGTLGPSAKKKIEKCAY